MQKGDKYHLRDDRNLQKVTGMMQVQKIIEMTQVIIGTPIVDSVMKKQSLKRRGAYLLHVMLLLSENS